MCVKETFESVRSVPGSKTTMDARIAPSAVEAIIVIPRVLNVLLETDKSNLVRGRVTSKISILNIAKIVDEKEEELSTVNVRNVKLFWETSSVAFPSNTETLLLKPLTLRPVPEVTFSHNTS